MVSEQATFTFYNVKKAGFYRHGSSVPDFGDLSGILSDLRDWAAEKTLKETKTFEADEEVPLLFGGFYQCRRRLGSFIVE